MLANGVYTQTPRPNSHPCACPSSPGHLPQLDFWVSANANTGHLSAGLATASRESPLTATGSIVMRILIADDHEVVRSGLRRILLSQPNWDVVAEAADGKEAIIK